ncbi:hypothetical protein F0U60_01100 [Archangium minus]|uniref:Uncharacterized protein n=1 Tax=Archangium minus TaxID=83450 RepID=A0ABY9WGZ7_9BACT|nr:hypothetical protein F0U60_01100 [Archangium minus]
MRNVIASLLTLGVMLTGSAHAATRIDVLSYILPGWPSSSTGIKFSNITDKGNPWRTYSNSGGNVGERLNGFFITKGAIDYPYSASKIWNFEQMIYDSNWIYLVRDTSWTSRCSDNNHIAGMLLFTYENNQWLRGGRHFPRFIDDGAKVSTGQKYIQGVERKTNSTDNAQEGRWCDAQYAGWTSSEIQATLLGQRTLGTTTFNDVLSLKVVGGSGTGDEWWFAKGYGLIRFTDGTQTEQFTKITNPYEVVVRIPCEPSAPCM